MTIPPDHHGRKFLGNFEVEEESCNNDIDLTDGVFRVYEDSNANDDTEVLRSGLRAGPWGAPGGRAAGRSDERDEEDIRHSDDQWSDVDD